MHIFQILLLAFVIKNLKNDYSFSYHTQVFCNKSHNEINPPLFNSCWEDRSHEVSGDSIWFSEIWIVSGDVSHLAKHHHINTSLPAH